MSSDPEAEIRASVGAHADLGPGYEDAVAEGLVERIGAEIDKRIEARLAQTDVPTPTAAPTPAGAAGPAGYPGFQGGYQGYLGPVLPPGYQLGPPPVRPSPAGARNVATTITALGSVGLGVAATAIVSSAGSLGGQGFIILLIWVAIAIINVAYARHS
jgi:hypothetical protein